MGEKRNGSPAVRNVLVGHHNGVNGGWFGGWLKGGSHNRGMSSDHAAESNVAYQESYWLGPERARSTQENDLQSRTTGSPGSAVDATARAT